RGRAHGDRVGAQARSYQVAQINEGGRSKSINLHTEGYSNSILQLDKGYERPSETMTSSPSTFAVARPSSLAPSSICLRHPSRSSLKDVVASSYPSLLQALLRTESF